MKMSLHRFGIYGLFMTGLVYASWTVYRVFPGVPMLVPFSLGWLMGLMAYKLSNGLDALLRDDDNEGIELDYEEMK